MRGGSSEASARLAPVQLGGEPASYSTERRNRQPRRGFLGGSSGVVRDTQRLLETCSLDLDPLAIRDGIRFAESLVQAIDRWRHLQARRREGVR